MDELKENLKTLLRKAINNAKDSDEKGEWITINGTHVFIPEGKTAEDVIKEKGWDKKGESSNFDKKYSEIEKIIKDKNWEPLEEENALEELEDYKREFNKNLEPRQEEALLEKLEDYKTKILDKYPKFNNPSEYKKQDKPKDNPSEGKKEKGERIIVRGKPLYIPEGKKAQDIIRKEFGNGTEADQAIRDYELLEDIHRTIQNCKLETEEDLKVLKGLKDILEKQ